jgi:hypothetical protein
VRQWCSAIFRYGVATLQADGDPAAALKGAISRPKIVHSKPLSRDQIAAFVKVLDGYAGYRTTVIALRLKLLPAQCSTHGVAGSGAHHRTRSCDRPGLPHKVSCGGADPRPHGGTREMSDVNDIVDALDKYGHRPGHCLVCGSDDAFTPSAGCCEPENVGRRYTWTSNAAVDAHDLDEAQH